MRFTVLKNLNRGILLISTKEIVGEVCHPSAVKFAETGNSHFDGLIRFRFVSFAFASFIRMSPPQAVSLSRHRVKVSANKRLLRRETASRSKADNPVVFPCPARVRGLSKQWRYVRRHFHRSLEVLHCRSKQAQTCLPPLLRGVNCNGSLAAPPHAISPNSVRGSSLNP